MERWLEQYEPTHELGVLERELQSHDAADAPTDDDGRTAFERPQEHRRVTHVARQVRERLVTGRAE
jgi:hypothetical protein